MGWLEPRELLQRKTQRKGYGNCGSCSQLTDNSEAMSNCDLAPNQIFENFG
jgi:hypothetical protein